MDTCDRLCEVSSIWSHVDRRALTGTQGMCTYHFCRYIYHWLDTCKRTNALGAFYTTVAFKGQRIIEWVTTNW